MPLTQDPGRTLASLAPWSDLGETQRQSLLDQGELRRYRIGQQVLRSDAMPTAVEILLVGQLRCMGFDYQRSVPLSLERLSPGQTVGWLGLLGQQPCETVRAATEAVTLAVPQAAFEQLLEQQPFLTTALSTQLPLAELFYCFHHQLADIPDYGQSLGQRLARLQQSAQLRTLRLGGDHPDQASLNSDLQWFCSNAEVYGGQLGQPLTPEELMRVLAEPPAAYWLRLIGLPTEVLQASHLQTVLPTGHDANAPTAIVLPDYTQPDFSTYQRVRRTQSVLPKLKLGAGPVDGPLACFETLADYFELPYRRDILKRVIAQHQERAVFSLAFGAAVSDFLGLKAQRIILPLEKFQRLPLPAMIVDGEQPVLIWEVDATSLRVSHPEFGWLEWGYGDLEATEQGVELITLERLPASGRKVFGLRWFLPYISRYRRQLIEVLAASVFIQLFALANPLIIQQIIDKVIAQNSFDTLNVLGILLLIVSLFQAVLTSLRTYVFVDTTNRIDLSLGSRIIDKLLRLPLDYFDRRPVGEISTRIQELENIRNFLTGTALTVLLDSAFSIIYIFVMFTYSPLLSVVTLATIPLFLGVTLLAAPLMKTQLRSRAESYAANQSHLVESLGGIQTIKAQNAEQQVRWKWQDRYSRFVGEGFKTILIATTAGSTSSFLNDLSGLLLLWVGAFLVLKGELTIGGLIAFRIIAGYVTGPVLRLASVWQNFQEVALSVERLGDIVDTAEESDLSDRTNIPLPALQGEVEFQSVCFRFAKEGPLQLDNVSFHIPVGTFVGIVGQSGSGKSTAMKLLPRLYQPLSGKILIDQYDIAKVELYSIRRQVGIVPQDSLLFDGSIQENIALTRADATTDEIIEAAKVACAHDFIMDLPQGYNTRVGERGAGLSGGQRQRIAIARAILQDPRLLILDEATSALDYRTERQVCLNLFRHCQGRTVFFITHRLSTIRHADRILMMDSGRLVEQGTHDELMALRGLYSALYQQQDSLIED